MDLIIFRIILACLIGFILGIIINRYEKSFSAIVFVLICMGAALVTITSVEFYKNFALPWHSDPGRIAAQIISALGFLGAGLIWISEKKEIHGLSQAAGLWLTAILGMLIGAGLNGITVAATFIIICIYWYSSLAEKWK